MWNKNFEGTFTPLTVVWHQDGLAFLTDEEGKFYSLECDPEVLPLGTSVEKDGATELNEKEQIQFFQNFFI